MMNPRASSRPRRHALLAVVPVLFAVSCGSDGNDSASTTVAPASSDGASSDAYCSSLVAIDAVDSPGGPTDPTPEATKEFGTTIRPLVDTMLTAAPASAKDAVTTIDAATTKFESGDAAPLQDPATYAAIETLEQAGRDECGWASTDVSATNYKFSGLPETLPAGPHSFRVTNSGTEPHVLLFVKKPADTKDDLAFLNDYLGAVFSGDPAAMEPFAPYDVSGGGAGADPNGGVGTHVTDLEPGTYIYFCPIPVGLAPDGAPHFTQGMHGEITVE